MSIVTSWAASVVRFPLGYAVGDIGPRPQKMLELYDFESCPFCRKVREACTMLDLEVLIRPCPRGGERFRPEAITLGKKERFPLLFDPNDDLVLYESNTIIEHLYRHYGAGPPPLGLRLGVFGDAMSGFASSLRVSYGRAARSHKESAPKELLHLWSFELSPYSRRVRERLCELEIPYLLHNVGKGSPRRDALMQRAGKVMVPYLEDPNTGTSMFESLDILRYLDTTYGSPA